MTVVLVNNLLHPWSSGQEEFDQPKAYLTGKHSGGVIYVKLLSLVVQHYEQVSGKIFNHYPFWAAIVNKSALICSVATLNIKDLYCTPIAIS